MERCKMIAIRMRTEGLIDPIGIAAEYPNLFWNCQGGQKQTAYQICAEEDTGNLLWDSGKVESNAMHSRWGGSPVLPKTKVIWKVRLWDETDSVGDWAQATFETGINTWSAKWITGDYRVNKKQRYPDCISPPAACMKRNWAGKRSGISAWHPAIRTTASVCSTRPTM